MILYNLRRIIIKFEKRFNISIFFLFPFRFILVLLEKIFLDRKRNLKSYSNYYLNYENLPKDNLIVVSAGVGNDISFEKQLLDSFSIKFIVLIDPTDYSEKLVTSHKKFFFEKAALFSENKKMKIYEVNNNINLSLENLYNTQNYFTVKTVSIDWIMTKYKLNKINILKLDVEGVADKVIKDCMSKRIFPDQICFELERPLNPLKQIDYFIRFIKIIFLLKRYHYKLYNCTDLKLGLRSEILAVKNDIK